MGEAKRRKEARAASGKAPVVQVEPFGMGGDGRVEYFGVLTVPLDDLMNMAEAARGSATNLLRAKGFRANANVRHQIAGLSFVLYVAERLAELENVCGFELEADFLGRLGLSPSEIVTLKAQRATDAAQVRGS